MHLCCTVSSQSLSCVLRRMASSDILGGATTASAEEANANGTYKLTPNTGSIRYMAPENGNKWPYNFLADSYSFGILLWEICSLKRPFVCYTPKEIRDMVMR